MDIGASGIIFGFVVVLWIAYVLPLVLLRYDEAQRKIPIAGSFSRVIPRSRPRAETHAEAEGEEMSEADREAQWQAEREHRRAARAARQEVRESARRAARRRRTVLYLVSYAALMIGAAAAMRFIPLWTVSIGVALVAAWLVACRYQVVIERSLTGGHGQRAQAESTTVAIPADAENTVILSGQFEDYDSDILHVMERIALERNALEEQLQIAVPSASSSGGTLWDPLPVTLPTYVTKPRAGRTVRTIDFAQSGTWTSGHIEGEQTEMPTAAAANDDERPEAVGS